MFDTIKNIFKKESSKPSVDDQLTDLINRAGQYGVSFKLAQDIFSDKTLSIHQEKARAKKAYNDNSFVQVAVNNLVNLLEGENSGVCSENMIIKDYGEKWENFTNFKNAKREAENEAIITGDGYIKKIKGSKGSFKYKHIENSEDMYIEWDYKNNKPRRYIRRLFYTEAQAKSLGVKKFTLQTPFGLETIFGIEYSPEEIIHFKFMNSHFGLYGRSPLFSILNDVEIMQRIERSIAVISMFKAIPQKILTPKQSSPEKPSVWTPKQVQLISKQLKSQKDFESSIVGMPMDSINVTDSGQLVELTGYLDYFKRKISISLSPEFIIHGELVNRSTSVEQKQIFYLSIVAMRDYFTDVVNESIQEGMLSSLNVLKSAGVKIPNATFWYEWGEFDVELRQEKTQRLIQEWNMGIITLNEYRESLGYEPDEEIGYLRRFDLMGSPGDNILENLKGAINGETKKTKKDTK